MKSDLHLRKKPRQLLTLLGLYSVLWFVCALLIYAIFRANGKLFLWVEDGVYQHFVAFDYLCRYLRSLLIDHSPMGFFNLTIGQGADILPALSAYGFTDPVNILAALLLPLTELQRFTLAVFFKLYLVGLSFIVYCYASEKKNLPAVLAGAVAYTFSGVMLFTFARHPCHTNWAYFFPLLLAGVELFERRGRKLPLVLFVFLNLVTSYYTFYMNAVLTVLYVLVCGLCRLYRETPRSTWREELRKGFSVAGLFLAGILLASFILFPVIYAFLHNPRVMGVTGYADSAWHYGWSYYADLLESLFEPHFPDYYYTKIGLNTVVFLPLVLLFTKKGHGRLKVLLLLSLVMLCLPVAGRLMNGMSYACNRWSYAAVFYGCFALVEMMEELQELSLTEKCRMGICAATYCLILLFLIKTNFQNNAVFTVLMLGWTVLVFVLSQTYRKDHIGGTLVALSTVGALFLIYFTFSENAAFYAKEFLDYDRMPSCYTEFSSVAAAGLDDGFYRIEEADPQPNKDGINGTNGTSLAWSLLPSNYLEYYKGLNLNTAWAVHMFYGLDGRTGLLDLASVKYYTRPVSESGLVPAGFEEIPSPDSAYQVYENQNALPIGYTYDRFLTGREYESLNGLEKEQALLRAAVLEEAPEGFEQADFQPELIDLEVRIVETSGVEWGDGHVDAAENGTVFFSAEVPEDCEIYMLLQEARPTGTKDRLWFKAGRVADDYAVEKWGVLLSPKYSWYFEQDAVAVNLGPGHAGENRFWLTFTSPSSFDLGQLRIIAVPTAVIQNSVRERGEHVLEDIVIGRNCITGTISVPEARILQFSLPYSSGWKAIVDGEETPVLQSGVLYLAVPLDAGEHTVTLTYSTPWLSTGCLVSALTLLALCVYTAVARKKLRK